MLGYVFPTNRPFSCFFMFCLIVYNKNTKNYLTKYSSGYRQSSKVTIYIGLGCPSPLLNGWREICQFTPETSKEVEELRGMISMSESASNF